MESERVLAIARQFNLDGITRTRGDLMFTTSRLLFVKTAGNVDLTQALLGFIGSLIASFRSERRSEELKGTSLRELVSSPDNVATYPYQELERIVIKSRRLRRSIVVVYPRQGRRRKYWGQRNALLPLLAAIPELRMYGAPVVE